MEELTLVEAIKSLDPDAGFKIGNNNVNEITWLDGTKPISAEDIETEYSRLISEYDANEYARNRASAYDSVGNQLDMMMKDMRDGTTTHQTACEAVKAKYPKPE
jgi:hypothetical protein